MRLSAFLIWKKVWRIFAKVLLNNIHSLLSCFDWKWQFMVKMQYYGCFGAIINVNLKCYHVAPSSMTYNEKTEIKSENIASIETPSSDLVEKTEYRISIACEKASNGIRTCKILGVTINDPHGEPPLQVNQQTAPEESPVIKSEVPKAQTLCDSTAIDSKDCSLCEILADMTRPVQDKKTLCEEHIPLAPQGRRLRFENKCSGTTGSCAPRRREFPEGVHSRNRSRFEQRLSRSI